MRRDLDLVFATHASAQLGCCTDVQLAAAGASRQLIARRVRAGVWERVHPNVLGAPGRVRNYLSDHYAALLSLPDGAIVSGRPAARLRHFRSAGTFSGVEVLVLGEDRHRRRSFDVRTTTWLPDRHRALIDDLVPIVIAERAWLDLLPHWDAKRLSRTLDEALAIRAIDLPLLLELSVSVKGRGHPGAARLVEALGPRIPGEPVPDSVLEPRLLQVLDLGGYPRPVLQATLPSLGMKGLVDARYDDPRLVIEADGRTWHQQVGQMELDRRRDAEASAAGYGIARFTHRALTEDIAWVHQVMEGHFVRGRWQRTPGGVWQRRIAG